MYTFDDITPLDITSAPVCQILYSDDYKSTMGTLLALMQNKEYSDRALWLTQQGIELLASHYTIWSYRLDIVKNTNRNLFDELDWCETIALDNEKNYQIWNYRQLIIEEILISDDKHKFNPHREYPVMNAMLEEDLKNHHVWSYRKWLVEKFDLFEDSKELEFIEKCLAFDVRNNSAWTHRFFVFAVLVDRDGSKLDLEIAHVKKAIELSPQNPSLWNYLLGLYKRFKLDLADLQPFCTQFANERVTSSFAAETLAQIAASCDPVAARRWYDVLTEVDPMRANYWAYRRRQV